MKNRTLMINALGFILAIATAIVFANCNTTSGTAPGSAEIDSLRNQVKQLTTNDATIAKNLERFDTLDYTVFTNQQWDRLHESHAADIKVYWPDGHMTEGIE